MCALTVFVGLNNTEIFRLKLSIEEKCRRREIVVVCEESTRRRNAKEEKGKAKTCLKGEIFILWLLQNPFFHSCVSSPRFAYRQSIGNEYIAGERR